MFYRPPGPPASTQGMNACMSPTTRRRFITASVLALTALAACTDQPTSVPSPLRMQNPVVERIEEAELAADERFDIQLEVSGSLASGAALVARATASSKVSTGEAEISIRIPQLTLIGPNGTTPRNVVGQPIAPRGSRVASMRSATPNIVTSETIIPAPGYYQVIASVVKRSDEPDELNGRHVRPSRHTALWVYVDEKGGQVTEKYDPTVIPSTWVRGPGRARLKKRPNDSALSRTTAQQTVAAMDPTIGLRQAVYYNVNTSSYAPAVGVQASWQIYDTIDHSGSGGGGWETDANGYWVAPCMYLNQYAVVEFRFLNSHVDVQPTAMGYGEWEMSGCTEDFYINELPHHEAHVFQNLRVIAPTAKAMFSPWTRGRVIVWVNPSSSSHYNRWTDQITIANIWGDHGGFTHAHEYGHAFQEKALGGMSDASGGCPSPHFLYFLPSNLGCAYREGFADYFAVAVFPSGSGHFVNDIESNAQFGGGDGSRYEGTFAAFLYDLTDPANELKDSMQYPYEYVASTFKSCEVWFGGRAHGTDHFVYCFERTVDPWVAANYFPSRSNPPGLVSPVAPAPPGWSQAAVRTNWLWNMYLQ
jgi:hypothetical protein